ncbi:uncharacterized protein ACHE_30838S [Aspergillus chevalieri]|uniref:DUF521 domain protein n=1 Tax=Aspergillus chevalieri TaxID=182096 RepID=A0A7R7VLE4_ASPCH|nr:uncharacterized protein ACHE_30838S [Aspergillus chevalieri]BCR86851.1 hypothetical protein ACHE_30838S [Aspergillus chevalieri]
MSPSTFQGAAYVQGKASGRLLASNIELSFWGGINPQTGEIIDRHHTLSGQFLQDTILAIPGGRGSCSGSGVMLELLLNDKGPNAILFERREDILTLGVMIAEEVFGKSIPVVMLGPEGFREVLGLDGRFVHVVNGRVYSDESLVNLDKHTLETGAIQSLPLASDLELSDIDRAFLDGAYGEAARVSMRIILRMADLLGTRKLMDITQVHVDGCIYTGPGCLIFAEKLRDWGGKVRVPTSLNSISIDQKRWRVQGIDPVFGEAAERLADTYISMGARPTFTCAPYQLESAPKFGEQVAWAESNAAVYANSVLGAKTMKYPDFLDISIALTGRAPKGGPHVKANRLASVIVTVTGVPGAVKIDDSFYPLLGYHVGAISPCQIPVVVGIESFSPCKDDLRAFGAAFATMSSAPMFHIVGATPEATSLDAVINEKFHPRSIEINLKQLAESWNQLNSASHPQPVDLVSLGNPHFSLTETRKLAELCRGRAKDKNIAITVTCGRSAYGIASQAGLVEELEAFGVQFITDTCWCMITEPIIPPSTGAIMTNSGKYAHYGPGLTGRPFYFRSLARCVEAACGGCIADVPGWLSG